MLTHNINVRYYYGHSCLLNKIYVGYTTKSNVFLLFWFLDKKKINWLSYVKRFSDHPPPVPTMGKPEKSDCEEKVGHRAVMAKMPMKFWNSVPAVFRELWSYLESQKKLGSTPGFWHATVAFLSLQCPARESPCWGWPLPLPMGKDWIHRTSPKSHSQSHRNMVSVYCRFSDV